MARGAVHPGEAVLSLAALPVALGGMAAVALATQPGLGAAALLGMSQIDGLTGHLDRVLPGSAFKLLSLWVLALIALTLPRNPAALGRPRPSAPLAAAALFAGWLVVTHLTALDPDAGEKHLKGFLSTMLLVPILALTIHDRTDLRRAMTVLVASGVISALCVFAEAKGGVRLTIVPNPEDIAAWQGEIRSAGASAYNPTTAAQLLMVSLVAALAMAAGDGTRRMWWLGAAVIMAAALPMMGARSALLGFVVGMGLLGWSARRAKYFPLIAGLVVGGAILSLPFLPSAITERFAALGSLLDDGGTADRTLLRRLSYNLIGWQLFTEHPIFGIGPGGFPETYASFDFRWFPGRELEPRQLHNAYLETLAETGLPGLLLFLTATFGAMGMAWRAGALRNGSAVIARSLAIAFGAFLFASLFMPNEDNKFMWILVALCVRAAWIAQRETP